MDVTGGGRTTGLANVLLWASQRPPTPHAPFQRAPDARANLAAISLRGPQWHGWLALPRVTSLPRTMMRPLVKLTSSRICDISSHPARLIAGVMNLYQVSEILTRLRIPKSACV